MWLLGGRQRIQLDPEQEVGREQHAFQRQLQALQGAAADGTVLIFVNPSWWNGPMPVGGSMAGGSLNVEQDSILDFKNSVLTNVAAIISTSGAWSITSDGILTAKKVEAEEVEAQALTVKQTDGHAAIGEGVIPDGYTAIVVHNPAMTPKAEVFVSFRGDPRGGYWVAERGEGDFTVHLAQPALGDLPFAYWIIGVDDMRTPSASGEEVSEPASGTESTSVTEPETPVQDSGSSTPGTPTPDSGTSTPEAPSEG